MDIEMNHGPLRCMRSDLITRLSMDEKTLPTGNNLCSPASIVYNQLTTNVVLTNSI